MLSDIFAQIESRLNPNHPENGIHDPIARVAALSTVDKGIYAASKGIDAARESIRSLLTRRNTLVPISVLPPEILARVFHLLVRKEPPFRGRRKNLGWIRVTHVCRHWRQVALGDSSLWSKISGMLANTKWISEMLARAKNAPLDIDLNALRRSNLETLVMIPPHLSHTRQLRFHGLSTLHSNIIREMYSYEAPTLEHLELTVNVDSPITFRSISGYMLFKGHAPRLRTLSLSEVVIPWSHIPCGQLTQLQIACSIEGAHYPGDLNQLIDLLVNCPGLEILALNSCLPSQLTDSEFSHGRTIHLPHLSRLRLCGSTSRIINMLKMLNLPSSTTLHLNCIFNSTHNDSELLLLPVISAQFQSPPLVEFKSLIATIWGDKTLQITALTIPPTLQNHRTLHFDRDMVSNAELVLSFDKLSGSGLSTDLLKRACKIFPISNLEFISFATWMTTNIIDINWVELFSCCTNVTMMKAIGLGTSSLVRTLTTPTVANPESSKEGRKRKRANKESTVVQPANTVAYLHAAVFPKLKFLEVREQNFAEGNLFYIFEKGLQQRMVASDVPLTSLCISRCDISTERANDLRKLVQYFYWDEDEEGLSGV